MSLSYLSVVLGVVTAIVLVALMLLLLLFIRQKVGFIINRLNLLEKEVHTVKDTQENNTVSRADIHGIVSSINEERLSLK